MKIFKINKELEIVCEYKKTRNGFKHEAILIRNGNEIDRAKKNYLNRTWERYEYQDVLQELVENSKFLTEKEKTKTNKKISDNKEDDNGFRSIAMIAKMGEIFGQTEKERNDWKARMIKAGLKNQGLIMPDDWNELNEKDKEKRLNSVIGELAR